MAIPRYLDVYRVVFAWRSHRKVDLERLTVQGVFAATDRLALCLAGPRLRRTAPTGHSNRPRDFTPRVSNIPDCDGFHALPAAGFGESPFTAYRTPMRAATTVTKICADAFLLGCRQDLGAPRSKSAPPLLRPSRISPARLALEFFILALLGRHLARCLIPPPRLCSRGLHFAQRSPVAIAGT
jgi:hypothetical protein